MRPLLGPIDSVATLGLDRDPLQLSLWWNRPPASMWGRFDCCNCSCGWLRLPLLQVWSNRCVHVASSCFCCCCYGSGLCCPGCWYCCYGSLGYVLPLVLHRMVLSTGTLLGCLFLRGPLASEMRIFLFFVYTHWRFLITAFSRTQYGIYGKTWATHYGVIIQVLKFLDSLTSFLHPSGSFYDCLLNNFQGI